MGGPLHDNHEPSCALCAHFVFPFPAESPLSDWGYCVRDGAHLSPARLDEIEARVRAGDYGFLTDPDVPLYEALGEGCENFEETGNHHHG